MTFTTPEARAIMGVGLLAPDIIPFAGVALSLEDCAAFMDLLYFDFNAVVEHIHQHLNLKLGIHM